MPSIRLEYLFYRYLNQELNDPELQELMGLLRQPANDDAIKEMLDDVWNNQTIDTQLSISKANALFSAILAADPVIREERVMQRPVRRLFTATRLAVAAVLLLCITTGV